MRHYIIMASAYSLGCRIALDIAGEGAYSQARSVLGYVREQCREDSAVSFHCLNADGDTPEDVAKADPYFGNVRFLSSAEDFVHYVQKDMCLSDVDAARYIMAVHPDIEAEKLYNIVELVYNDYLLQISAETANKDLAALDKGALRTVCSRANDSHTQENNAEMEAGAVVPSLEMALRSRILAAENGKEIIAFVRVLLR